VALPATISAAIPDLSWLPKVRHLLGVETDDEVALRAGVSQSTVTKAR
jgi:predicted transcriptional regulator